LGPIPNPQSPIPNPQSPLRFQLKDLKMFFKNYILKILKYYGRTR